MSVVRAVSAPVSDFTCPLSMSAAVVPPTMGVNTSFDSPKVPWQKAQRVSQIFLPSATLPEPAGSPLKSGRTSMSHAAISSGVAGRPIPSKVVAARVTPVETGIQPTSASALSHLDIVHLPALFHLPRLDRVVVVDRSRAAHRAQLVDAGLHIPRVVHRARLEDGGRPIPHPVDVEARERLREHGRLQARSAPVAPAVERDIHPLHASAPGPGEAGHV